MISKSHTSPRSEVEVEVHHSAPPDEITLEIRRQLQSLATTAACLNFANLVTLNTLANLMLTRQEKRT